MKRNAYPPFRPEQTPEERRETAQRLLAALAAFPEAYAEYVAEVQEPVRRKCMVVCERLASRRLGRPLTGGERRGLAELYEAEEPERFADALFDLSPDELAAWLTNPGEHVRRTACGG